jgi:1-acyl-sn-glycerol-3-phosphate acyltransferase
MTGDGPTTEQRGAGIWRWLTVGLASYLAWLVVNLALLIAIPLLFPFSLLDRRGGYRRLRRAGSAFLRGFFVGYLTLIRLHRFAELPPPELRDGERPRVLVANHRSWLDALLVLAFFPRVRVPVNATYVKVPLLGLAIRWMGCIPLDRSSPAALLDGIGRLREVLERGESLAVFPEGARAEGCELGAFTDVFFRIAIEAAAPVVPLLLHSDVPYLTPAGSYLTARRASWRIRVLDAIAPDPRDRPADLARRVRKLLGAALEQLDRSAGGTDQPEGATDAEG